MTEARKQLVEEVARALYETPVPGASSVGLLPWEDVDSIIQEQCLLEADAVIALVGERIAKIVEAMPRTHDKGKEDCSIAGVKGVWTFTINNGPAECAAAIRSLTQEEKQ